jgi:Uma2 family endonuclease
MYTFRMTAQQKIPERPMTPEEYLAFEEQSDERFEYDEGELFMMAGETLGHEEVVLNVTEALRSAARERGCRFSTKTIKLHVSSRKYYCSVGLKSKL